MAREEPLTEEEHAEARERFDELREEVREQLAEDLGGDPEDYDASKRPVPDGSGDE